MRDKKAPRVSVEWIYVRYSTVVIILAALVLASGGAAWWFFFNGQDGTPREDAEAEIAHADSLIAEARVLAPDEPALALAGQHVESARNHFVHEDFAPAMQEAGTASVLARDVIDRYRGGGDIGVRVVRVDGDVRIKRGGQFLWEEAVERARLETGDQVKTSQGSTAQLVYFDGSVVTVQPGTLLEIRELTRDPANRRQRVSEHLAWGTVRTATQAPVGVDSVHEVNTESASVRARNSAEFQVTHDQEKGRSEVVSVKGELQLRTGERTLAIPESTRVELARGEVVSTSHLLAPPRPLSPPDQKAFMAPRESLVKLAWEPLPEADFYRVQLSDRPLFTSLLSEHEHVRRTSVDLPPLSPGVYYWRAAGVDEQGHLGRWSLVRKFQVLGAEFRDPDDTAPPPLKIAEILVVGTNAIISGSSEPGSLVWIDGERVDVEEDGRFTWVIKLHQDGRNKIDFVAQDAAGNETRRAGYAHVEAY